MNNNILQKLIKWANEIEELTESAEITDINAIGTKILDLADELGVQRRGGLVEEHITILFDHYLILLIVTCSSYVIFISYLI